MPSNKAKNQCVWRFCWRSSCTDVESQRQCVSRYIHQQRQWTPERDHRELEDGEEGGWRTPRRGCLWEDGILGTGRKGLGSCVLLPEFLTRGLSLVRMSLPNQHLHTCTKEGRGVTSFYESQVPKIILPLTSLLDAQDWKPDRYSKGTA